MIEGIETVTVCVRDQERALAFYVGTLGFEKREDDLAGDYRWLTVAPPGSATQIYLAKAGPGELHSESEAGGQTGIMLRSGDVEALHARLSGLGVTFQQPPTPQPWGGIQAQVEDPDGNVFFLQEQPPD
jgi:catechol 2,3-dioxygenase-like lactoylglutathione lyase family enzyme